MVIYNADTFLNKKEGKDQESIQSSTTPDTGYQWEIDNFTIGSTVIECLTRDREAASSSLMGHQRHCVVVNQKKLVKSNQRGPN